MNPGQITGKHMIVMEHHTIIIAKSQKSESMHVDIHGTQFENNGHHNNIT